MKSAAEERASMSELDALRLADVRTRIYDLRRALDAIIQVDQAILDFAGNQRHTGFLRNMLADVIELRDLLRKVLELDQRKP